MSVVLTFNYADGSSAMAGVYDYRHHAEDAAFYNSRPTDVIGHTITDLPTRARTPYMQPLSEVLAINARRRGWHMRNAPAWVQWRDMRTGMRQHIRGHVDSSSIERVLAAFDRLNERMGPIFTESALEQRLAAIRVKAIQWYERGVICWNGTRQFCDRFGVPAIECADVTHPGYEHFQCDDDYCDNEDCERADRTRTHTVDMTVRITFTVTNQSDAPDTRDEIRRHAYIDSDGLYGIDDGIDNFDASIQSVYVETD
jgi:hypothetical protein